MENELEKNNGEKWLVEAENAKVYAILLKNKLNKLQDLLDKCITQISGMNARMQQCADEKMLPRELVQHIEGTHKFLDKVVVDLDKIEMDGEMVARSIVAAGVVKEINGSDIKETTNHLLKRIADTLDHIANVRLPLSTGGRK